jgi:solute carrier family 25 (mitochondrial phosphate transporter), member 3
MAKFVVYEKVSELIYQSVDKSTASAGMQTTINLGSGLVAGLAAAVISQPADTMLSKINKTKGLPGEGTTSRLIKIARELGLRGSFAGLPARLFMVGVSDIPDCPVEFRANLPLDTYSRSICNLR